MFGGGGKKGRKGWTKKGVPEFSAIYKGPIPGQFFVLIFVVLSVPPKYVSPWK